MTAASECAFCSRHVAQHVLWESEHYRILADAFPRCAGHVLLVSKAHLRSHMHAPADCLPEFEVAQQQMGRFLTKTFGTATFYENGGARQEVPHAHLHGLPFRATVAPEWVAEGQVEPIRDWTDARRECERAGFYFYLETPAGPYLVRNYERVLLAVRAQLIEQTEARLSHFGDDLERGGPNRVARTVTLWRRWESGPTAADSLPPKISA